MGGVTRGLHTRARVGLYKATPPETAGSPEPFWTTMTLGLPGLTVLMTPGSRWPVRNLCWAPGTPETELGTTYTAVADLGTILVLECEMTLRPCRAELSCFSCIVVALGEATEVGLRASRAELTELLAAAEGTMTGPAGWR